MVECDDPVLPVERQCALLGLARSTFHYVSIRDEAEDEELMRLLDAQYTRFLSYGVRRMTHWLQAVELTFDGEPRMHDPAYT